MPTINIPSKLAPRQMEVAQLAVAGLSNDEIATKLGIATNTVKVHLKQISVRLDVRGRKNFAAALETTK